MLNSKNILILVGRNAIISLVVVSISVFAIVFLVKEIEHISDSVVLNHHLNSQLNKRISLVEVLKKEAEIVGINDVLIENAFISSENILKFITALDDLVKDKSIIQIYRFETPIPSAIVAPFPISSIAYSDSLTTNISTFSDYLKEFEKLPYFTKIEGISISSQSPLGWQGESTILLRATLYTKAIE